MNGSLFESFFRTFTTFCVAAAVLCLIYLFVGLVIAAFKGYPQIAIMVSILFLLAWAYEYLSS